MERRVEDDFIARYPDLFRQSTENPVGVHYWGIECEQGWLPLLDALCSLIQARINNQKTRQVTIRQIKEKFGDLRISYDTTDEYVDGLINMTVAISRCTCELCGHPGSKKKLLAGWVKTVCQHCEKKLNQGI